MAYDTKGGALGTIGRQALQGATLGFSDEIIDAPTAAIIAALTGQKFSDVYDEARGLSNSDLSRDRENAPATSFAANIVGGLPFALGGAGNASINGLRALDGAANVSKLSKLATAITRGEQGLQDWVRGGEIAKTGISRAKDISKLLGRGFVVGSGRGAVSGFGGSSPDPDKSLADSLLQRLRDSGIGASIAGPLGALASPLSRLGGSNAQVDYGRVAKDVSKQTPSEAEKLLAKELAARPDLQEQLARAEAMHSASKNTGIDLTLAEKIAQSQSDPLLAQQKILGGNPTSAGAMEALYSARSGTPNQSGQIENALTNHARQLDPNVGSYDDAANSLIKQAGKVERDTTRNLVSEARPYYQSAEPVDLQQVVHGAYDTQTIRDPILDNPVVAQTIGGIMKHPAYQTEIAGNYSPSSIKVLDLAARAIKDQADTAERAGERNLARLYNNTHAKLIDSLEKASPEYQQARQIYSGQPDKLLMRERMGSLADIDPMNAKKVAQNLFSGTQQNADVASQALGEQGSKTAAAARIYDAMDTARGDPTSLAGKIAPDARTMDMLRTYAGGNQLDETLNVINQAKIGEKFRYGSPTNQLGQAERTMNDAAGTALDVVAGTKIGLLKKVVGMFKREQDPQFYQDMMKLMTTDQGMELVRRVAQGQGAAIDKQQAANTLMQAMRGPSNAVGSTVSNSIVNQVMAPSMQPPRQVPAQPAQYAEPDHDPFESFVPTQDADPFSHLIPAR